MDSHGPVAGPDCTRRPARLQQPAPITRNPVAVRPVPSGTSTGGHAAEPNDTALAGDRGAGDQPVLLRARHASHILRVFDPASGEDSLAAAPGVPVDPRRPGGRYYDASLGWEYEVLAIDRPQPGARWTMTVRMAGETVPVASSASWDPARDGVIAEPPSSLTGAITGAKGKTVAVGTDGGLLVLRLTGMATLDRWQRSELFQLLILAAAISEQNNAPASRRQPSPCR